MTDERITITFPIRTEPVPDDWPRWTGTGTGPAGDGRLFTVTIACNPRSGILYIIELKEHEPDQQP